MEDSISAILLPFVSSLHGSLIQIRGGGKSGVLAESASVTLSEELRGEPPRVKGALKA